MNGVLISEEKINNELTKAFKECSLVKSYK